MCSYEVIIHLRGAELQRMLKPLCCNLTHSFYSAPITRTDFVCKKSLRAVLINWCVFLYLPFHRVFSEAAKQSEAPGKKNNDSLPWVSFVKKNHM